MAITAVTDISGLVLDLDPHEAAYTDTAGTTPASATDAVARVDDQTAGAEHVIQATSGNRPTLQQDANGWKYLDFVPANAHHLENTTFEPTASGVQPFTGIIVYQVDDESASRIVLAGGGGDQLLTHRAGDWQVTFGANFRTAGGDVDTRYTAQVVINGASSQIDVNGGSVAATGNAGANAWTAGIGVGALVNGGAPHDGRIYRVLMYDKVLSATEITDLYDFLNTLYSNAPAGGGGGSILRHMMQYLN